MEFGYQMLKDQGDEWCKSQGIDFWNYGAEQGGWAATTEVNGRKAMIWQFLVQLAFAKRVSLVAAFTAKIRGGEVQVPAMTFKPEELQPDIPGIDRIKNAKLGGGVDSFVGFTYSAACSVAEVDVLTGEVKVISSDIVYDMGWSMNPAIDIGQVEGAFVQGLGYLMTEKLVFEPDGADQGRLNSTNTWRYKIPAVTTIPLEMNTYLFPRSLPSVEHPGRLERHLLREGSRRAAAGAGQQRVLRDQGGDPRVAARAQARWPLPVRRAGHRAGSAPRVRSLHGRPRLIVRGSVDGAHIDHAVTGLESLITNP